MILCVRWINAIFRDWVTSLILLSPINNKNALLDGVLNCDRNFPLFSSREFSPFLVLFYFPIVSVDSFEYLRFPIIRMHFDVPLYVCFLTSAMVITKYFLCDRSSVRSPIFHFHSLYTLIKIFYFFFIANVCHDISAFRIRHQSTGCNTELSLRASIVLRGSILQRHSRDYTEGLWSRTGWVLTNYSFRLFLTGIRGRREKQTSLYVANKSNSTSCRAFVRVGSDFWTGTQLFSLI